MGIELMVLPSKLRAQIVSCSERDSGSGERKESETGCVVMNSRNHCCIYCHSLMWHGAKEERFFGSSFRCDHVSHLNIKNKNSIRFK